MCVGIVIAPSSQGHEDEMKEHFSQCPAHGEHSVLLMLLFQSSVEKVRTCVRVEQDEEGLQNGQGETAGLGQTASQGRLSP